MAVANDLSIPLILLFVATLLTGGDSLKLLRRDQREHGHGSVKLFVFGDSYADTGNWRKSDSPSWNEPYGITYPGKPAGRFSDGRVLTDYIASYLGIRPPVSYAQRESVERWELENGMNFAYGGTGVFNTMVDQPNMTTQIDYFQHLLDNEKVYTRQQLMDSSIALISVAGNDYATYMLKNGNMEDTPGFSKSMIEQIGMNMKRILGLGIGKIAVTSMEPMGCLPQLSSFSSYKNCSEQINSAAMFHNQMLQLQVQKLSDESPNSVFVILDLYNAFLSSLKPQVNQSGNTELMTLLQPCCIGKTNKYGCGSVEKNGAKQYSVCGNPEASFFWDNIHPSQNGWLAVFNALKSSLHKLI